MQRMSAEELAKIPGDYVGTKEASAFLGCDRYSLNISAKAGMLGIPFFFAGNRLKISKRGLLENAGYISGPPRLTVIPGRAVEIYQRAE